MFANKDSYLINSMAIEKIDPYLEESLDLFVYNYEKYPSIETCHNLAVFLSAYEKDDVVKDYKEYSPVDLFQNVINKYPNFYTFSEYGDFNLRHNQYEKAERLYFEALKYKETSSVLNNLAVTEFYMQNYEKALSYFKKASLLLDKADESYEDNFLMIEESYAFSAAFGGFYEKALSSLYSLNKNPSYMKSPDTLLLADLCREYKYILENYEQILNIYSLDDITLFQTVSHAFILLNFDKFEQFRIKYRMDVEEFHIENPDIDKKEIEELLDIIDNGPYFPEYKYLPQMLFQCNFLGCNNHNNPIYIS